MKVLSPAVTILLTSHHKPYLAEAIESVLGQTRRDFEVVVADSGAWIGHDDERSRAMADIHARYAGHPLVMWVTTGEPADLRSRACPVAWVTNAVIRAGLVRGRYVCTFYDDDLYYPAFVERMAGFLDEHPERAVWCSQDRVRLPGGGIEGRIMADGPKHPGEMDCRVDGAQVMFRREMLDAIGDPWLPEEVGDCFHSDGLFLERLAAACGSIPAIPEVLLAHRFTPLSTYTRQ